MSRAFKYITAAGKLLFPSLLWNVPAKKKVLYLTFDDGPVPEVTPWVLSLLKEHNAKATFFCIGENVKKYPKVFEQVIAEGHSIGNHTHNHLNGWKTGCKIYIENILLAERAIRENLVHFSTDRHPSEKMKTGNSQSTTNPYPEPTTYNLQPTTGNRKLFRPPFGKITPWQIKEVKQMGYEIVMWEVISGDYNDKYPHQACYDTVISQAVPGSIIVFHDSIKASGNLKKTLPGILEFYKKKGFVFEAL